MLAAAERRAARLGLDNVAFREASADDLPFEDATFDSVGCRFGFMFFPDLSRAASEIVRVLKPGGRACVAVWAGPEQNPWATVPMAVISTEVEMPPPDPDAPGMFRCAAPGALAGIFEQAGLSDVTEDVVATAMTPTSPQQYWQLITELTAPVVAVLETMDEPTRERIGAEVVARVAAFDDGGGVNVPGAALCISGTK
jgi:SAM-dependent methyltransferase